MVYKVPKVSANIAQVQVPRFQIQKVVRSKTVANNGCESVR